MKTDMYDRATALGVVRSRDRPLPVNHLGFPSAYSIRTLNLFFDEWWDKMAKKSSRNSTAQKPEWQVTFIDLKLDKSDQADFRKYASTGDGELSLELAQTIADGNKLSVAWDDNNQTYIASFTCKDEDSVNYNCCISSRSQEWFEAILLGCYKINKLCYNKPWKDVSASDDWG